MKRTLLLLLIILIVGGASWYYYDSKQLDTYVTFASSQNHNSELREALIVRLKANNIPYQVDTNGSILIPEIEVKNAVICCT